MVVNVGVAAITEAMAVEMVNGKVHHLVPVTRSAKPRLLEQRSRGPLSTNSPRRCWRGRGCGVGPGSAGDGTMPS